jgi:predicted transposase YdaD
VEIINPHDKIFKEVMGNVETAKSFVENYLPKEIIEVIDFENLEPEKDSFIDKKLQDLYSDILFKTKINNSEAYLYFLFEHKSYIDKMTGVQLLKYIIAIWEQKVYKEKKAKLPIIIPILIYHGKSRWSEGCNLRHHIEGYKDLSENIKKYIPDYNFNIYDFSDSGEIEIKGNFKLMVYLKIIGKTFIENHQRYVKLMKVIFEMFEQLDEKEREERYFETILTYILSIRDDVSLEDIKKVVQEVSYERGETVMTAAEKLRTEGMQVGMEKGRQEGRQEEKLQIAKNLIKFGMDDNQIEQSTGLTIKEIKKLREN